MTLGIIGSTRIGNCFVIRQIIAMVLGMEENEMIYYVTGSFEKETELIVEFMQHRKHFKAFEENKTSLFLTNST